MKKRMLFNALLSMQIGGMVFANIIYVPAAQPTIQAGVDAAINGDTVLVADGVYSGAGNTQLTIATKQLVLMSENGPDLTIIDLELSGQGAFVCTLSTEVEISGFAITRGNAPACVAKVWGSSLTLVDCVIKNCKGEEESLVMADSSLLFIENSIFRKSWAERACAISLSRSSARIVDCTFDSLANRSLAIAQGGAIYAGAACSLSVLGTHFRACWATELPPGPNRFGGAVFCDSAVNAEFIDCFFEHNEASQGLGGAIFSTFSTVTVTACQFSLNGNELDLFPLGRQSGFQSPDELLPFPLPVSAHSGGAIYALLTDLKVHQSAFINNGFHTGGIQSRRGGAIFLDRTSAKIGGCTFGSNEASQGEAIFMANSSLRLDSCVVAFNTARNFSSLPVEADTFPNLLLAISCSNIYGNENGDWGGFVDSLESLYDNFSLDPQFCGSAVGNFYLQEDSPCRPELSPCGSLVGALPVEPGCNSCCEAKTGNANMSASDLPDLSDLSLLIAYLTVAPPPVVPCEEEANVNASGSIDLSDLSAMIAFITAGTYTLPWCP